MRTVRIRVFFSCLLTGAVILFLSYPFSAKQAQTGKPSIQRATQKAGARTSTDGTQPERPATGRYIIEHTEHGSACRQMSTTESAEIRVDQRSSPLTDVKTRNEQSAQAQGLKITLRATAQLNNSPQARDAFLRAAAVWQSMIETPIEIVIDADFGPTFFGEPYSSPNVIGATDTQSLIAPGIYGSVRSSLRSLASSPRQSLIFDALPVSSLPTESGAATAVLSPSAIFRSLGFIDPVADPDEEEEDFGPPPAIGFNSNFAFDFDPTNGIDPDKVDFEAVALHEMGHALGFSSDVGSRELIPTLALSPTVWDFFRFRPGTGIGTFSAGVRLLLSGGEHTFFGASEELALSTGRPDGNGGDGEQSSHWKDDAFIGKLIGLMDPTLGFGRRERISSNDIDAMELFGYNINSAARVFDELEVDDGFAETTVGGPNVIFANRVIPLRYPAKVETLRVRLGSATPTGVPLRAVIFVDAQRTGQPPANPSFVFDQTFTVPVLSSSRFFDLILTDGPTIAAGDIYIGFQSSTGDVRFSVDSNSTPRMRSFISVDGQTYLRLQVPNAGRDADANLMARAVVSSTVGSTPTAEAIALSPNAASAGSAAIPLFVNGRGFQHNSVVRWKGSNRATTWLSGSQIRADIQASDLTTGGTAQVTVFTPATAQSSAVGGDTSQAGTESVALNFTIGPDKPEPVLTRLEPALGALGGPALTLNVVGLNFDSSSVLRWNGEDRPTTVTNSVSLSASIPAADLTTEGTKTITVLTPGPGGGTSNSLTITVTSCTFSVSPTTRTLGSAGGATGVTLTTLSPCTWTAQADVPWISFPVGSGTGKAVVNFQLSPNTSPNVRIGTVTLGSRQITVRQMGALATVSAASFAAGLAPNAIAAGFGAGLSNSTQQASTVPLPFSLGGTTVTVRDANLVTRTAGLFFAGPGQINFLVPAGTANGTALVTVSVDGLGVASGNIGITSVAPAIFTANASGSGVPAAETLRVQGASQTTDTVFQFDSMSGRFVPKLIDLGPESDKVFLILYASGVRGFTSLNAITARIGDVTLPVQFAGPHGFFVGVDQLNLELPRSLIGRGEQPLTLVVNGRNANGVTVAIK